MKTVHWLKVKLRLLYRKIVREKASPEYIARGWAIGMFYGCLIPFGLQLACSIPTAFLLKGSKIGATLGTLLTNHFTIFIIYPAQCYVGSKIMGGTLTYEKIESTMAAVLENQDYQTLWSLGWDLVAAFFIGGLLLTLIMTPITYFGVLAMVRSFRRRRQAIQRSKCDKSGSPCTPETTATRLP